MKKTKKKIKKFLLAFAIAIACVILFFLLSNLLLVKTQTKKIVTEAAAIEHNADCILILGAAVWSGSPSPMLEDRLLEGLSLYKQGAAPKILVSGDHGQEDYDEVNIMKQYLIDAGVPSADIFMDHAGFSTYESIVRARQIFGVKKMIVVTQKYHIYRALYICGQNDIDAVGVNADPQSYTGEVYREFREMLARDKDILACLLNVPPTYGGPAIDIAGNGNKTNDNKDLRK